MFATEEIKKMNSNELLDSFSDIVPTEQDWENESTVLIFENATATICGSDVTWE